MYTVCTDNHCKPTYEYISSANFQERGDYLFGNARQGYTPECPWFYPGLDFSSRSLATSSGQTLLFSYPLQLSRVCIAETVRVCVCVCVCVCACTSVCVSK